MSDRPLTKILYVEDEDDIRQVALMALEVVGKFQVKACSSGLQALDGAAGFGPELILLDVMMPGMDGPATFAALRQVPECKTAPVIFMTAKVQAQEVNRYLTLGAAGVIAKPFDPMTLSDQIREIWRAQAPKGGSRGTTFDSVYPRH